MVINSRKTRDKKDILEFGRAMREAILCTIQTNQFRDADIKPEPFTVWDFLPGYDKPKEPEQVITRSDAELFALKVMEYNSKVRK